jgi:hypothetical protein
MASKTWENEERQVGKDTEERERDSTEVKENLPLIRWLRDFFLFLLVSVFEFS